MGVVPGAVWASAIRAIDDPITRAICTAESRSITSMATMDWNNRTASTSMSVKTGVVPEVQKAEGPPESSSHLERDPGGLGHFGLGETATGGTSIRSTTSRSTTSSATARSISASVHPRSARSARTRASASERR